MIVTRAIVTSCDSDYRAIVTSCASPVVSRAAVVCRYQQLEPPSLDIDCETQAETLGVTGREWNRLSVQGRTATEMD